MNEMACQAVATARQGRARGTRATVDSAPIGISSPVIVASAMVSGLFPYPEGLTQVEAVSKTANGGANPSRPAMTYSEKVCQRCGSAYTPTSPTQKICKSCRAVVKAERQRAYNAAHREESIERSSAYRAGHTEAMREKALSYKAAHRDELCEKHRAYNETHREERRTYLVENKDRVEATSREYWRQHPEKVQQKSERRRALKYGNTPVNELLTEAQWRDILDQYGHRCAYCGRKMDRLTIDHVIPLTKGGKHSANNVVPACRHCNSTKGARTPEQWGGVHV